jgi:hypothetical protein
MGDEYDNLLDSLSTPTRPATSARNWESEVNPALVPHAKAIMDKLNGLGYDVRVGETRRSVAQEQQKIASGYSRVRNPLNSKHVTDGASDALDLVVYENGQPDWKAKSPAWKMIGDYARSNGLGWGGDIKGLYDPGHIQVGGGLAQRSASLASPQTQGDEYDQLLDGLSTASTAKPLVESLSLGVHPTRQRQPVRAQRPKSIQSLTTFGGTFPAQKPPGLNIPGVNVAQASVRPKIRSVADLKQADEKLVPSVIASQASEMNAMEGTPSGTFIANKQANDTANRAAQEFDNQVRNQIEGQVRAEIANGGTVSYDTIAPEVENRLKVYGEAVKRKPQVRNYDPQVIANRVRDEADLRSDTPLVGQVRRGLREAPLSALEGTESSIGGAASTLGNAADVLNADSPLIPKSQALTQARDYLRNQGTEIQQNATARDLIAPSQNSVENFNRNVFRGAGATPLVIAQFEALGVPGMIAEGALSREHEGIGGMIKGAIESAVPLYGMQATGKILSPIVNGLTWTAIPTAKGMVIDGKDFSTALGESVPGGVLAGVSAEGIENHLRSRGFEPYNLKSEDGRTATVYVDPEGNYFSTRSRAPKSDRPNINANDATFENITKGAKLGQWTRGLVNADNLFDLRSRTSVNTLDVEPQGLGQAPTAQPRIGTAPRQIEGQAPEPKVELPTVGPGFAMPADSSELTATHPTPSDYRIEEQGGKVYVVSPQNIPDVKSYPATQTGRAQAIDRLRTLAEQGTPKITRLGASIGEQLASKGQTPLEPVAPEQSLEAQTASNVPETVTESSTPKKYQHLDFGMVTESENQSGVARGSVRVVDEQGAEHIIQRSNGRGQGNNRAIPVRSENGASQSSVEVVNGGVQPSSQEVRPNANDERVGVRAQRSQVSPEVVTPQTGQANQATRSAEGQNLSPEVAPSVEQGAKQPVVAPQVGVGPHGRFTHLLHKSYPHPQTGKPLPAFLTEPSVRKAVGLSEVSSEVAKTTAETQKVRDAIAQRMRAPRSSYLGPNGFNRFIDIHKDKLSNDAIDAYHATQLEHEDYGKKLDGFLTHPEVDKILSEVQSNGTIPRGTEAQLARIASRFGVSKASADQALDAASRPQRTNQARDDERRDSVAAQSTEAIKPQNRQPELIRRPTTQAELAKTEPASINARGENQDASIERERKYLQTLKRQRAASPKQLERLRELESVPPRLLPPSSRAGEAGFITLPSLKNIENTVVNLANLPRALMTSFDLSAPLRQGAIFTLTEPRLAAKAFADMFRGISSTRYETFKRNLDLHPLIELAEESGLHLTSLASERLDQKEEAYMSDWTGKIPGVKQSEQAYVSYLDSIRMGVFEKYAREMGAADIKDPDAYKSIARFINAATGRGDLGKTLNNAAPVLNSIFFSPRYLASRIQLMNPVEYMKMPPAARKIATRKMFEFAALIGLTLFLLKQSGMDVNLTNPDSPDWLKVKSDNTRYDFLAGFQQPARFAYRLAESFNLRRNGERLSESQQPGSIVGRFLRSKENPSFSLLHDYVSGEDFNKEPFQLLPGRNKQGELRPGAIGSRLIPMIVQDSYEGWKDAGGIGVAKSLPATMLGVGVQTYTPNQSKQSVVVRRPRLTR